MKKQFIALVTSGFLAASLATTASAANKVGGSISLPNTNEAYGTHKPVNQNTNTGDSLTAEQLAAAAAAAAAAAYAISADNGGGSTSASATTP